MPLYKFIISYDGTKYSGWQSQKHCQAVSNCLEKTFQVVLKKRVKIIGGSRTDAGVHALGQVAIVKLDMDIDPLKLQKIINNRLPADILIRKMELAEPGFHPQSNVEMKTYYYHFFQSRPLPIVSRYGYYFYKNVDLEKLQDCFSVFLGTHDFRSFCSGEKSNTIRTIDSINLRYFKKLGIYRLEIRGQHFLRYMIRRIAGSLLEVASSDEKTKQDLIFALNQKNPQQHLATAPAHGLMLHSIKYKEPAKVTKNS